MTQIIRLLFLLGAASFVSASLTHSGKFITACGYLQANIAGGVIAFVLAGFMIASSTDWERIPLSNPAEVGGFTGAVLQLLGLIIALVAALVATRQNYRTETPMRG